MCIRMLQRWSIFLLASSWVLSHANFTLAGEKVTSEILVTDSISWDGGDFEYSTGEPKITIQRISVSPGGQALTLPVHCHPMPLAAYVLKGGVTVVKLSGQTEHFKSGDAFIEVMETWHQGVFTEDSELLVFYAGTVDVPLSVTQGTDAGSSTGCMQ
jgi:quercetin dioxygenase-like cupin family protein